MDHGASQLTLGTYQQPMGPAAAYNPSPGQPQPTGGTSGGWKMHPHQPHQEQHQQQHQQQHPHQEQHQHQYQHQHQQQQHQQQQQPQQQQQHHHQHHQQHQQPMQHQHQHQHQHAPVPQAAASQNGYAAGPTGGVPNSPQALMNALSLLQQNIGALQALIPLMAQQQQQQPSDTAQAQQLQQQQAAASASVASVISQLALAASNILPQMGMAPPVLPPQVGMAPPAAAPQIGMAPAPAVPAGTSTGYNPVSSAANPASQLLVLPQNAVPQHQHQHQHQQQQQQPQQQQQETSTPVNRQKQLISSLGASGSLLQQQAAQLTLATQSPPYDESPRQQSVIKLVPPAPQESDDLAAKLQLSQPGFAPTMAAPQQAKAAVPPRPAPPQAQTAQTQAPALARQFPKQGAVDRLLGGAILLTQKRKLGSDGGTAIVASGATAIPGNGGFPGSDLARKRSKENVGEDIGGKQRGSPEGDDDDAALPEGSYDVIEMDPVELLAEHTHFCEICGKGFKRDANLRMHMRGHGDEYKTPEALARPDKHLASVPQRPKRFSCPFVGCKRNSQHQRFLPLKTMLCVKNHYRRTHCPKMLACSKCGAKRFSVVADLKTHEKHCGRDRWLCSCGTSFSRKDKLLGHLALFKGHRPANPSLTAADDAPAGAINDGARVEAPAIAGPSVPAPPQAMEREREVVVYQESPAQLTLGHAAAAPAVAPEGHGTAPNGAPVPGPRVDGGGQAILFGMSGSRLVTADLLGSAERQTQQ